MSQNENQTHPQSRHGFAVACNPQENINALAFTPDGHTLISGSADGEVRSWRAASDAETAVKTP